MVNSIRIEVIKSVGQMTQKRYVPAAVSGRHVHLCARDVEILFGKNYELTPLKPLSQPGQYAAKEVVTLIGPKGSIDKIRVLGPVRPDTQVEISVTDSFKLGIKPIVRMSGDVKGSPGGRLKTELGETEISCGIIVSAMHLHASEQQAVELGLKDGQTIALKTFGVRPVVFENVLVRSGKGHFLEVHLDTDEANAALLKNGEVMEIV